MQGPINQKFISGTYTLSSANWSGTSYALTVSGLKEDDAVFVGPQASQDGSNELAYSTNGVRGLSQEEDTLNFEANTAPSVDIIVEVIIIPA